MEKDCYEKHPKRFGFWILCVYEVLNGILLHLQKWGSDHLALVCELAFADDSNGT